MFVTVIFEFSLIFFRHVKERKMLKKTYSIISEKSEALKML